MTLTAAVPNPTQPLYCAIDFGTSNSAIAIPDAATPTGMRLVELEPGHRTMPTAVFYGVEDGDGVTPHLEFGRAAIAAYVDGLDGRLMRSMKSILGSDLLEQTTDVGGGRGVKYIDVVAGYLRRLKTCAEQAAGAPIERAILGRPVFFVDGDPVRDARAEKALCKAAGHAGFRQIEFQFEPIAAAFDYEQTVTDEERVLVADIGGGTSDFSIVRVGPQHRKRVERKADILANHGVHVAGTDFDRRIELANILPHLGFGAYGPSVAGSVPREVPSAVYFDLATWHLINTVYSPQRVVELKAMRHFYGNPVHHDRLMCVVNERLGHDLAARAEAGKIEVAVGGTATVDLGLIEKRLQTQMNETETLRWIDGDLQRIVATALETVAQAGLRPAHIDALYFTGGSTGLRLLGSAIADAFPRAKAVRGDRFASVATGLALHAKRRFSLRSKATGARLL